MRKRIISLFITTAIIIFLVASGLSTAQADAIIADHAAVKAFDDIPDNWIDSVANLQLYYIHQSHGSQILQGMKILYTEDSKYYPHGMASIWWPYPGGDEMGWNGDTSFVRYIRSYLDTNTVNCDVVSVAWCAGAFTCNEAEINKWMTAWLHLVTDFPDVSFVVQTSRLFDPQSQMFDPYGRTIMRANQYMRNFADLHNMYVMDYGDIEGFNVLTGQLDSLANDSGSTWLQSYCQAGNDCPDCVSDAIFPESLWHRGAMGVTESCAHSYAPEWAGANCYRKGKAWWWLMARVAGWDGGTTSNSPPQITSPTEVDAFVDSAFLFTSSAYDPEGSTIQLSFIRYPSWMTTNGSTISGTAREDHVDTVFTVVANDGTLADTAIVTVSIQALAPAVFLADGAFSSSVDDADLRLNSGGQDWYESRNNVPELLTLSTDDVGGNFGAKAIMTGSSTGSAYLSQEFGAPQTGTLSVQWDIYIEEIINTSNPDRAGFMFIGDDSYAGSGPNADNSERFVYMAFFKYGGGTSGTMDLVACDRDDGWTAFTTVATGLYIDQWYTIRVDCNLDDDTYDIYVDGVYQATVTSRMAKTSVTHISFAQLNNGAGTFFVDNVEQVISEPVITSTAPGSAQPNESFDLQVTGQHLFFGQGTASIVTLLQGSYVIPATDLLAADENGLTATFDIPTDAPLGQYDLEIHELGIGSISKTKCMILANPIGGEWQWSLTATGESIDNAADASTVTIGIGPEPHVEDGPPNPIDYTVDLKLYQQDWNGPYISEIQENSQVAYSWVLGLNPHGTVAPPITERCAVLQWNPAELVAGGRFQLVDMGIDGSGDSIVVEDMGLATDYQVCGLDILHYLKVVYWNDNNCVEMNLTEGWQLVSLPVVPIDNSPEALFPNYSAAWKFDHATGQYIAATAIEPCQGYWLKMPGDASYSICGSAIGNCDSGYFAGWHLIGGPDCMTAPASDPVDNILALWTYDASAAMYVASADVNPFLGYWIKLQNNSAIAMDCGSKSALNATAAASKESIENHVLHVGIDGQPLGGVTAGEIIIGLDTAARAYPAAPAPPEYSAGIAIYHSDWSGPYYEDIRLNEEDNTLWILAVNPHGNIAPPTERTATLFWNPGEMGDACYELRKGTDSSGAILIEDMRTVNSYTVTGTDQSYYFTVGISRKPTDVDDDGALPTEFALCNSYPNPFNPTTTIEYSLPRESDVTIDVFNITGQRVCTLVDSHKSAGEYSVIWNGRDETGNTVSSGIYLYRLTAGEYSDTKKMALLK